MLYLGKNFKTAASLNSYKSAVGDFLSVTGLSDLKYATKKEALFYVNHLEKRIKEGNYSTHTRNTRVYQLRSVFDEMNLDSNPFSHIIINEPKFVPKGVTILPSEIESILSNATGQLLVAIKLALMCGLSVSEICRLSPKSLSFDEHVIVEGAGFERIIPLPSKLYNDLAGLSSNDGIFVTARGNKASVRDMQRYLAKITPYTFQDFRVYAIVHMFCEEIPTERISAYTGIIRNFTSYRNCVHLASPSFFCYDEIVG